MAELAPTNCNISQYFANHSIVFGMSSRFVQTCKLTLFLDITFCGEIPKHIKGILQLIRSNKVTGLVIPILLPVVRELVQRY